MIVDVPSGVNADVSMVTAVEHVGVQDVAVNVAVVPGGSPVALKGTGFGEPDIKMAATVFDTDDPCATDRLPPFASTKLKDPDSAVTTGLRTPISANSKVRRQIHLRHRAQLNTRERTSPSKAMNVANVCQPLGGGWKGSATIRPVCRSDTPVFPRGTTSEIPGQARRVIRYLS